MKKWYPYLVKIKCNTVTDERFEQILAEISEVLLTELRQLKKNIPLGPAKGFGDKNQTKKKAG